jgi:hypothetical protein
LSLSATATATATGSNRRHGFVSMATTRAMDRSLRAVAVNDHDHDQVNADDNDVVVSQRP